MGLIHLLLDPAIHGLFLLGCWILAIFLKGKKWSIWTGLIFWLWVAIVIVSPMPILLVETMEAQYLPLDPSTLDTSLAYNILILGAGKVSDPRLPPLTQLSGTVQRRLVEGIRLYRKLPKATIVTSASSGKSKISQARTVAEAALLLGVSASDTLQLPSPVNTETEARAYTSRFDTEKPLILVTSALHMKRAVYWFRKHGIEPVPAPCDYRVMEDPDAPLCRWCPTFSKLDLLKLWIHEEVGMLWAYLSK